jgi:hypothetical protein
MMLTKPLKNFSKNSTTSVALLQTASEKEWKKRSPFTALESHPRLERFFLQPMRLKMSSAQCDSTQIGFEIGSLAQVCDLAGLPLLFLIQKKDFIASKTTAY